MYNVITSLFFTKLSKQSLKTIPIKHFNKSNDAMKFFYLNVLENNKMTNRNIGGNKSDVIAQKRDNNNSSKEHFALPIKSCISNINKTKCVRRTHRRRCNLDTLLCK